MSESYIFINESCHTGQLREASLDLIFTNRGIIGEYTDSISRIPVAFKNRPDVVLDFLSAKYLPNKARRVWDTEERRVSGLLLSTRVMKYPHRVDLRIGEFLETVDPFKSADGALTYLTAVETILSEMLSDNLWKRIGSLRHACLAYIGSRVLRKAFFRQVFIMPPRIDEHIF